MGIGPTVDLQRYAVYFLTVSLRISQKRRCGRSFLKVHGAKLQPFKKEWRRRGSRGRAGIIRRLTYGSGGSLTRERPPRSNPALMGRVQPECQPLPRAADFLARLTTNTLPKKRLWESGGITRENESGREMERKRERRDAKQTRALAADAAAEL